MTKKGEKTLKAKWGRGGGIAVRSGRKQPVMAHCAI